MKTHICFDLDGTIIDSLELMEQSWENATKKLGVQCEFSEYKKYIGIPFNTIIEKLGLSQVQNRLNALYFSYNNENLNLINLNPDFYELVAYFDKEKIGWSIITSKPKNNTEAILEHFKIKCPYLICPEDVPRGKPFEDSILKLKELTKVRNEEILYIGDMLSDLQFAINSSVAYVHYTNGIEQSFDKNLVTNCSYINRLSDIKTLI